MKFSLTWLKDHLETEASVEEFRPSSTPSGLRLKGSKTRPSA
jgi:hypothetical protein